MATIVHKTWKPRTAGILIIVAGLSFIGAGTAIFINSPPPPGGVGEIGYLIIAATILIQVILPIIGGIYALLRKRWGLALAGSICACPASAPFGIPATVFIVLAKDEFE